MKRIMLSLLVALAFAGVANAATFGFDCIAGASQACGVGEASLSVNVIDSGSGTVTLTFANNDPGTSSMTGVYLDDSGLIGNGSISNGAGTKFKKGGKPTDLLGGAAISFTDDFRFTAKKAKPVNGLQKGETLSIVLTLKNGATYADVISALGSGALRIGLHLADADPGCVGQNTGPQCTGDPGAASFVNLPNPVPEPMAEVMGGLACVGLALFGRRR